MVLTKQNYHQRGELNIAQGVLPFKYEKESSGTGMTGLAGLLPYLDLAQVQGMSTSIGEHIGARKDSQK